LGQGILSNINSKIAELDVKNAEKKRDEAILEAVNATKTKTKALAEVGSARSELAALQRNRPVNTPCGVW
jgi:hypothetical protein